MKSIIKYIAILAAILTISSCEDLRFGDAFLEKPVGADVTIDTIFSKKVLAENFLAQTYFSLYYGVPITESGNNNRMNLDMLDALTDLVQSNPNRGAAKYYAGAVNAGTEDRTPADTKYEYVKEGGWAGIRSAYIFIENVNRVKDMTDDEKRVRAAEAKMIIACHYADMYRHFGGLPWISKALYPGDDIYLPRLTVEETANHIVALIDEAAADLPWALSNPAVDDGRFTKAAAMALKIRILLFTASPLFNSDEPYMAGEASDKRMTWLGGKDMNWYVRAEEACKAFFDTLSAKGTYALVNSGNPRTDFIRAYHARGNNEILISTRKVYKSLDFWNANYYFLQAAGQYGTCNATFDATTLFQFADGTNFDETNSQHMANMFYSSSTGTLNRDPRLYETMMIQGDRFQGNRLDVYVGGWVRNKYATANNWLTGLNNRKFLRNRVAGDGLSEVVQWPYLRLSEVYLSYAEVLNELGKENEAYRYINAIRDRVGMPHTESKGALGQVALREEILNERVRELMLEDVRWYDIIRWKREDIFKKRLRGLEFTRVTGSTLPPISSTLHPALNYRVYDLTQDRFWRTNFSPKWYLSPFPPSEVYKAYGLVQNPGW